jgi:uncharacterized protein
MPVTLTYPGVYIEELPSAVHTITGVATSIAAFVGWAPQGPTGEAVLVQSFSEFERQFGGLTLNTNNGAPNFLGYAVNQFFGNGGQQTYIVRLVRTGSATATENAATASANNIGGALHLWATSPGEWGNHLQVKVTLQKGSSTRFSVQVIQVTNGNAKVVESFANLSTTPADPQYVVSIIDNASQFVTFVSPATQTVAVPSGALSNTLDGPNQHSPTESPTGGTLPAATYFYKVSALYGNNGAIESLPSNEESVTTSGTTSSNTISWDAPAATTFNGLALAGYKIYRGTAAGQQNVFYSVGTSPTTFHDTGASATVGSPSASLAGVQLSGGRDGTVLTPGDGNFENALLNDPAGGGLPLLDRVPIFNLLCVPGEADATTIQALQQYCHDKRAFYIVDCPQSATIQGLTSSGPVGSTTGSLTGQFSINSAYYFPWISAPDPLASNRPTLFPPCGFVAGIYASTDAGPGVWKAPAGIDASLTGASGLQYVLTDLENGNLNIQGINCLREFRVYGDVVWGARTLQGSDDIGSQWKYVPIRRFALFLESSLYDGTQWVVFEPNDERLWSQIRLNVGAFMQSLFLKGAFQGTTPQQAYFVKCDGENNPQSSIDQGIVNILVGFAPLYPAEFVVIQIQQMAGQLQA